MSMGTHGDMWMTPLELAKEYNVSHATIYKWLKLGGWKRVGQRWLIRKGDLDRFLRDGERAFRVKEEDDASLASLEGLDILRSGARFDFLDATQKTFYVHRRGEPAAVPILWEPWQIDHWIKPTYYNVDERGQRNKRLIIISVPAKEGKTTMAAAAVWYDLMFDWDTSPEIYSCAGTKDQAALVFKNVKNAIISSPLAQAMRKEKQLKIYKNAIEVDTPTRAGVYRVLAREAFSAHGLNPTLTVYDEMWNQPDAEMWEATKESPARTEPLTMVISYAGFGWQKVKGNVWYDLWQRGIAWQDDPDLDRDLHFYHTNVNRASWKQDRAGNIDAYLERMKRYFTTDAQYRRLVLNEWVDSEDSALTEADINAIFLRGKELGFQETWVPQAGWRYTITLDLGLTGDATVAAVFGRKVGSDLIRICNMRKFEKRRTGLQREVDIDSVEDWLVNAWKIFGGSVWADPDQFKGSIQRLTKRGLPIKAWNFVGPNINRATKILVGAIRERQIASYPIPALEAELRSARIVSRSYGMRLEVPRIRSTRAHEGQHGDHLTTLCIGADVLLATNIAPPSIWSISL